MAVQLEIDILKKFGHQAEIIQFNNNIINGVAEKFKNGIKSFYNPTSYKIINQKVYEYKPDIIHVHNLFFQASPSILFAAKKNKIPVVMTLHNYRLICANALLLKHNKPCTQCITYKLPVFGVTNSCYRDSIIESALVTGITGIHKISGTWKNYVTKYIALTNFAKDLFLGSSAGLKTEQIIVKPNFVVDSGIGLQERDDFYLFVGRISAEKGVIPLLEAFAKMPHFKIVLAGDGPLKEMLEKKYKNNPNIEFIGVQQRVEIMMLMKTTKALVFPSVWYEGLPYTIIEALSVGTPVLCSNIGAMNEIIIHNYNGLHFRPNNFQEIIDTVEFFDEITNEHLYKNARTTYIKQFHPEIHYKTVMEIYTSLINNRE